MIYDRPTLYNIQTYLNINYKINKYPNPHSQQKNMQQDLTPGYSSSSLYRNNLSYSPTYNSNYINNPRANRGVSWTFPPKPIVRTHSNSRSPNRGSTYINNLNYLNSNSSNNLYNNISNNINAESIRKTIDDIYMYPTGFAELLKNQSRNVKSFKLRINKQKQKVDQDLSSFKIQLNHTIQDLRLSLHALLDRIYQCYLDKTAKFKGELFQINRLKDQLQIQLGASSLGELQSKVKLDTMNIKNKTNPQNIQNLSKNYSNPQQNPINNASLQAQTLQTISNMQAGNHQFKKYYILNYIADIQRQRVGPLSDLQREIVVMNSYQNGYYQSGEFLKVLAKLREVLTGQTKKIYQNNYLYIRDPQSIIIKDQQSNRILDGLQLSPYQFHPVVSANPNLSNSLNLRKSVVLKPQPIYVSQPQVTLNPNPNPNPNSNLNYNQKYTNFYGSKIFGTISPSEQSLKTASIQNINLSQQPLSLQLPSPYTSQPVLCATYINNQLALGLKSGIIQILSCDGHSITTLKQHAANICVLAVIRTRNQNYLVSGADVGCCRVIVWDPVTWQPKYIFNSHNAAVTGIVDLQDDTHILSTGYDKRMNIYSIGVDEGRLVHTAPQTQAPMTALLVNKSGSKLVACGLDKAIYVWEIVRNYQLKAQNIILERKIQNNSTISAIVASQILPQLIVITTKDSKIKLVNIDKGQSYKTVSLNNDYENAPGFPIELVIIQRQNKAHYPIALVWPYKQRKIYQINTETTLVSIKNLIPTSPSHTSSSNSQIQSASLQYGYGVNPKSIFISDSNRGTLIYCVNQRNNNSNCVSVFRVEEIK